MNTATHPATDLDARLRRMYARLDAQPGFESRLQARLARLAAPRSAAERVALVRRLEHERYAARAALDRHLRSRLLLALAAGVLLIAGAWRFGPELGRALGSLGSADPAPPVILITMVLLAAWLWHSVRAAARGVPPWTMLARGI
jgi:hypothetical protein